MDLVHSSYVTCSRGPCVRHHRAVARVVRRAEDDVSRRGPLSVAALALGAQAVQRDAEERATWKIWKFTGRSSDEGSLVMFGPWGEGVA